MDIVAGRYFYRNPADNIAQHCSRTDLGKNVDGMLFVDVDGDEFGAYYISIPDDPLKVIWDTVRITKNTVDEGIGIGDINPDGHLDVVLSTMIKRKELYSLSWYKNPCDGTENWQSFSVNTGLIEPDRIILADLNGDQLLDIAGPSWNDQQYLHLWRNDAVKK